jgi:hypothetical protein
MLPLTAWCQGFGSSGWQRIPTTRGFSVRCRAYSRPKVMEKLRTDSFLSKDDSMGQIVSEWNDAPSLDGTVNGERTGRVVLESDAELKSTWVHRAWVGGTTTLLGCAFMHGILEIRTLDDAVVALLSASAAYILSDLGTAIYHWAVDNYGDAKTPVFGGQIDAFQGHHHRPWTITEREFCNNVHKVFAPAAPVAGLLVALAPVTPAAWSIWSSLFLFLVCMSQQFHAWSHMKRSELHPLVLAAQESGILISRKSHGAHHKAPFDGNYAIVSGWWNPILDGNGRDTSFFRWLETIVHKTWGIEPRCWYEPQDDLREVQARG